MSPSIIGLYESFNRSLRTKTNRVRCISVQDFDDIDEIELEMQNQNMIVIFFKEIRIKKSIEAKRILQYLNAFIRQYEYTILNLGKLDYLILLPNQYELSTNQIYNSE
ncbi:MAG: hypothetical protein ACW97X_08190 [Candidatus Hodarchaeales archaeon]|jgi:SepF-like predicted cell division protein (DUF552 family)